jgi:hypothetical protein
MNGEKGWQISDHEKRIRRLEERYNEAVGMSIPLRWTLRAAFSIMGAAAWELLRRTWLAMR